MVPTAEWTRTWRDGTRGSAMHGLAGAPGSTVSEDRGEQRPRRSASVGRFSKWQLINFGDDAGTSSNYLPKKYVVAYGGCVGDEGDPDGRDEGVGWGSVCSRSLAVLAGSVVGGGALLAVSSAVVGSGQAGADTPTFNMTCTGVPGVGTVHVPDHHHRIHPDRRSPTSRPSRSRATNGWSPFRSASPTPSTRSTVRVRPSPPRSRRRSTPPAPRQGSESETLDFGSVRQFPVRGIHS